MSGKLEKMIRERNSSASLLARLRLGDKVEKVTRSVGIKPCGGCLKRKKRLNGEE